MGSISIEIRQQQKAHAVAAAEAHTVVLTEAKLDVKAQSRNPKLRALKAEVRKAEKRLKAIDARQAHVETIKEEKAKAKVKAEAKAKSAKGGKKAAPEQGGKKKAKKK